jgi:hypothetical protein
MQENPKDPEDRTEFERAAEAGTEAERRRCIDIVEAHYDRTSDNMTKHLLLRIRNLIAGGEPNPEKY